MPIRDDAVRGSSDVHALVMEGVFAMDGTFRAVAGPSSAVLEEGFRRLLPEAPSRVERLTEEFEASLASWPHSG